MSSLQHQVRRAQRRLTANHVLEAACLALIAGATAWLAAVLVNRLLLPVVPAQFAWSAAGAVAAIVLVAGAIRGRVAPLAAALAVDSAAGLKERLSTAWALRGAADPFAQAALRDAEQRAAVLHVPAHVPLRAPQRWPWSAAVLGSALLVGWLLPDVHLLAARESKQEQAPDQTAITQEQQAIREALREQQERVRTMAESNPDLKDLTAALEPLELGETPTLSPEDVRREAVKKIDAAQEQIARKMQDSELAAIDEVKRQLRRLENKSGADPASKLSDALSRSDMASAKQALEEMRKQLQEAAAKPDGDPQSKQQLAEMAQKLEQLAADIAKLADEQQITKDLQNKAGLSEEDARKLMEKLAQMDPKQLEKELQKQLANSGMNQEQLRELAQRIQKSQQSGQQCKNLSEALAQAAKAMQQCSGAEGSQESQASADSALTDAASQLSNMEMAAQMLGEMQAQLGQLERLRDEIGEGRCQGGHTGRRGSRIGRQGGDEGLGSGEHVGREKAAHTFQPDKLKGRLGQGQIIGQMLVDGAQVRGEVSAAARDAVTSAVRDAQDAIERQQIPRQYERVTRTYFERLAGLLGPDPAPPRPAQPATP